MGVPQYGRPHEKRENAIADSGGASPEVLGVINTNSRGAMAEDPGPPPWEVEQAFHSGDAHAFVEVPSEWVLRWINPRTIERGGDWRYWQKVDPADSRVKIKVDAMKQVDNTIRRGGVNGDILAWMHKSWVKSANQVRVTRAQEQIRSAREKRELLNEEFQRGTFGKLEALATHTSEQVNQANADRV